MMLWNMASQQNIRHIHSGISILLRLKLFLITGAFSTRVKRSHKNNKNIQDKKAAMIYLLMAEYNNSNL